MTIRNPTVLILGAASSIHCGYPLGKPLIANVVRSPRRDDGIPIPKRWNKEEVDHFVTRLSPAAP